MPQHTKKPEKRRKILTKITMDEISGVDDPAHEEHARVALIKRKGENTPVDQPLGKRVAATNTKEGHQHTLVVSDSHADLIAGTTSWEVSDHIIVDDGHFHDHGHSHSWIMGEDGVIKILDADGHSHKVTAMSKAGANADIQTEPPPAGTEADTAGTPTPTAANDGNHMTNKNDQAAGQKDQAVITPEQHAELQKRAERAEAVAELSPEQLPLFKSLDREGQDEFLTLSGELRDERVRTDELAKREADPVVYTATDGRKLRKSANADFIAEVKRNDKLAERLAKSEAATQDAQLNKRAGDELGNVPGEHGDKVELLKAVDGITDPDARTRVLSLLKSSDAGIAKAMKAMGVAGSDPAGSSSEEKLDALAKKRASDKDIPFPQAYSEVMATPEGESLYTESLNG